jgi:hypothetical protein
MRPNLSVEKIAGALAVLGAAALVTACGGETKPPVNANEVAPSGEKKAGDGHCGADAKHDKDQAQCGAAKGAGSCGAGKGAGSCGAAAGDTKAADPSAAGAGSGAPSTTPTDAKPADTKAADTKGATATPAPSATTTTTKKGPPTPPAGGKKGGASGCGAGTCSAKK